MVAPQEGALPKPTVVRFAVAALAAALLLAACSDRVPPPETPTPSPTPRPSATPSPEPTPPPEVPDFLQGVSIRPLRIDFDIPVTTTASLIIELGCTQCDGPTTGFARVYGRSFGTQFDVLLTPEMLPLPAAEPEDQRYIAGFGFAPDGSELIAGVCVHGYCGGLGGPTPNAEVWLFRSEDGGISWTELQRLPRPELIVGWLGPGSVLTSHYDDSAGAFSFTVRPTGEAITPPVGHSDAWPSVATEGHILWHDGGARLLYPDGRVYAETDQAGVSFGKPLLGSQSDLMPLSWDGDDRYYLAQMEPDGSVLRAFVADPWVNPEAWLSSVSDDRVFASASVPVDRYAPVGLGQFVGVLPAIIDLGSASVLPISQPFLQAPFLNGRNHVVAVQQGPFARVVNTGDCLNVRDAPVDGEILECVRDNVLVLDLEHASGLVESTPVPGWLEVRTPSGRRGWASAQYLER